MIGFMCYNLTSENVRNCSDLNSYALNLNNLMLLARFTFDCELSKISSQRDSDPVVNKTCKIINCLYAAVYP